MRRTVLITSGCMLAVAVATSGWTYALARPARVHDVTVTRTVHVPVIKTRTITVTQTKTRTVDVGSATPCVEQDGTVVPAAGGAAGGAPGLTTCAVTIKPDPVAADGDQVVLTAPDGTSGSYQLGPQG